MSESEPARVVYELLALFGADAPDLLDRMPVVRTGEREPISEGVRRGIWLRDCGECQWCGHPHDLEIDHIIPWSNGGSDRSDNLRLLCTRCNEARSNRRTDVWTRVLPLTYECRRCMQPQRCIDDEGDSYQYIEQIDPVKAYCVSCRAAGIAERWSTR